MDIAFLRTVVHSAPKKCSKLPCQLSMRHRQGQPAAYAVWYTCTNAHIGPFVSLRDSQSMVFSSWMDWTTCHVTMYRRGCQVPPVPQRMRARVLALVSVWPSMYPVWPKNQSGIFKHRESDKILTDGNFRKQKHFDSF